MKRIVSMGIAAALIASAGAAFAYPSLLGPTGGANLPSADTAKRGKLNVVVDHIRQDYITQAPNVDPATSLRLVYGFTSDFELGATYDRQTGTNVGGNIGETDLDSWSINGKYVTPFVLGGAKWSLGASYLKYQESNLDTNATQLFMVGNKYLYIGNGVTPTIRGGLGANWTRMSVLGVEDSAIRPTANLDFIFGKGLTFSAEYQVKNADLRDIEPMTSFSVRYPFTNNLVGQLVYTNSVRGLIGSDDHHLSFGVNYTFDGFPY